MNTLQTLQDQLVTLKSELIVKQNELKDLQIDLADIEKNPQDYMDLETMYDEDLDSLYHDQCKDLPVNVTGSKLIKEFDPIMYRCGFNDFIDQFEYSDLDCYTDKESEIEDVESEISDLESVILDLEDEIENLENNE
jgi:predicted  nucleic acid-binding Zn-ribbon protein